MFGTRLSKISRLVAAADRAAGGKFDLGETPWDPDATGHNITSQSLSSYSLRFYVDNTAGAAAVCLVDGRLPIAPGTVEAEDFGNVMPAGTRGWLGPFSALNGPWNIVRISTAVADVTNIPTRYSVELDQKAT